MNTRLLEKLGLDEQDFEPKPSREEEVASIIDYNVMMGLLEDPSIEVNDVVQED